MVIRNKLAREYINLHWRVPSRREIGRSRFSRGLGREGSHGEATGAVHVSLISHLLEYTWTIDGLVGEESKDIVVSWWSIKK